MQNEKGFSLVEVVASLVIISIVLLSLLPFFINAKTISQSNMERLVVINLADATMERLKIDPYSYIEKPKDNPRYLFKKFGNQSYKSCADLIDQESCSPYEIVLNGNEYNIEIQASQSADEAELKLIGIIATVTNADGKIKYPVEGYVKYE